MFIAVHLIVTFVAGGDVRFEMHEFTLILVCPYLLSLSIALSGSEV